MLLYPDSKRSRRPGIRRLAYALFFCAVLLGSIITQMYTAKTAAAAENRLHRAILAHMNEENDALRRALADRNWLDVRHHADTLSGYASLFETLRYDDADNSVLCALADTAQFYSALGKLQ